MSFATFLEQRGITDARLTKSGRADRRNKMSVKLEDEWFNLSIKGESSAPATYQETCPVCYDVIGTARATTPCGHNFCIPCFTQSVRENDNCAMCRAPLSNSQPKKTEPMGTQVSHQILGDVINNLSTPLVVELFDTIYHDIGVMEGKLAKLRDADDRTRQGKRRECMRRNILSNILRLITERYMIFGYNVIHRTNLWFTEESPYPFDPVLLVNDLETRRDEAERLRLHSA
jgi:hypothetical protein